MKITIIQSNIVWEDIETNLLNFSKKIDDIKEQTDIIILPEMFATGFLINPQRYAQKENGQIYNWLSETANKSNAVIIGSVITERIDRQTNITKYYNRLVFMQPDGKYQTYDKRHLFSFGGEHKKYSQGSKDLIVNFKDWRIKLLICYDLRFPVWSRNKKDYDLLIYIANWPHIRSNAWKTLLMARAVENLSYVIGVNRVGKDGNNISHSGDSAVINYKGDIVSNIKEFSETTETVEISMTELSEYRKKFPAENDADDFEINI